MESEKYKEPLALESVRYDELLESARNKEPLESARNKEPLDSARYDELYSLGVSKVKSLQRERVR